MRILVTNDDGIDSPGLHALAAMAARAGHDVFVAAPAKEESGMSAALTAVDRGGHIAMEERVVPALPGVPCFAVSASPAFIVLIATRGAFGAPPEVVLSGINRGPNTGAALLHSGTVGAALTGVANGCRAMAVSLDVDFHGRSPVAHWETAAELAGVLMPLLTGPFVLNVNVPNLESGELRGVRRAHLAEFGMVQMTLLEQGEGYVKTSLEQLSEGAEPGSDDAWLLDGYAAVTAVYPPREALDLPLAGLVDASGEPIGG